jgi:hypothetical protein
MEMSFKVKNRDDAARLVDDEMINGLGAKIN